jgi:hypothetical protein
VLGIHVPWLGQSLGHSVARGALVAVKALTDAGGSVAGRRGALDVVAVVVLPVF